MNYVKRLSITVLTIASFFTSGCGTMKINLIADYSEPLREFTVEGKGGNRILVVPITGLISAQNSKSMMESQPSVVQEVVSHLRKAQEDTRIKAVILKVNSPGGTVTASDLLYHEITKFQEETGIPVIACMMDMATSGGYYVSLPCDYIIAHPTTVTGSVGVVFMRPKFAGLMDKIGVGMEVSKSGNNKDMGSPFRATTDEEVKLFQGLIDHMAGLFKKKLKKHRDLSEESIDDVMSAKVYVAQDALDNGLIDKIGFLDDAVTEAAVRAEILSDYRVVMYRRLLYSDDNIYNDVTALSGKKPATLDLGIFSSVPKIKTGFYYIWPATID